MRKVLQAFFIVTAWLVGAAQSLAEVSQAAAFSSFQRYVADVAAGDDIVGLAVAVVRDGDVTLIETHGVRENGTDGKIDHNTTFRIASLSKSFASSVAGQLVAEGRLGLDDPAAQYSPDFRLKDPKQLNAVTLEHILSHRVSLPPYAYDNLLEAGIPPREILKRFDEVSPICSVGRCYAYQNVAFNIIAEAVAAADGRSYEEAVQARLFAPLGLYGASFGVDNLQDDDNWARSHRRRRGGPWRAVDVRQPYYDVPAAGGVNASISDMAGWLVAQMGHEPDVLSSDVLDILHSPRVETPAEIRRMRRTMRRLREAHYGLGWRIYNYAGMTVINHSGSVEGYSAQIAFLPERNVGIVLLTNSRSKEFWEILPTFLDIELGFYKEACETMVAQSAQSNTPQC